MATSNLSTALILRDFVVSINGVGKVGQCPSVTIPEFNLEMEDFRGGGMFGTVEIPLGIEKLDYSFDLFTWDADIWKNIGYGVNSLNVPFIFAGNAITPAGSEEQVRVDITGTLKSIKTDAIVPGKQVKMACAVAVNAFKHTINQVVVTQVDIYNNIFTINGVNVIQAAVTNTLAS